MKNLSKNIFPTNIIGKKEQKEYAENLINLAINGGVNPLQMEVVITNIERICKEYRSNIEVKKALLNEAEKYKNKSFEDFNAKFQIKEVGVEYDFSECNHLELNELSEQQKKLDEKIKEIKEVIKCNKNGFIYTSKETGETYEVLPCLKTSTTQVVTTIK